MGNLSDMDEDNIKELALELYNLSKKSYEMTLENPELFADIQETDKKAFELSKKILDEIQGN